MIITNELRSNSPLRQVGIAVLAKAPIAGLAKTRLIPALGVAGAARLQRRLTRHVLQVARDAALGPVTLWCTPDVDHRFFRALRLTGAVDCRAQPAGDLGAKMHAAFVEHAIDAPLLLIGTDCPVQTAAHLQQAAQALLDGADAVFQPAEDGGYVLVGLRQPRADLFVDMTWSTAAVMSQTRLRAQAAQLVLCELDTLWDVDEPADLDRLRKLPGWG